MTSTGVRNLNQELLEAAERLVREYDDLAAGSVLRSFARAVQRRTRTGVPTERLAESAERLARDQLDRRRLARSRLLPGAA